MREGLGEWTAFNRVGGDWERVLNMGKGLENKKGLDCKEEGLGNVGRDWYKQDEVCDEPCGNGLGLVGWGLECTR